ncbi:MAG: DUF2892 domain-containing protein [Rhodospirillaceae bacterium]|nr:DUF2892 domain-containing protein [Rhodospirillaceae bacterium]
MLPSTTTRVADNTAPELNDAIRRRTEANLAYFAQHPDEIQARLDELDREWDIERVLETQASSLTLLGTVLGATVNKRFLILPAVVGAFFLQHALQGWCPPVPVLRRLGVRTQSEIEAERHALKALRGDFRSGEKVLRFVRGRAR